MAPANNLELSLDELLVGPTAIAFVGAEADGSAGDIAAVAKALRSFTRRTRAHRQGRCARHPHNDAEDAQDLADMPSREQVLAQIAGLLEAPLSQMASLLEAPVRDIAYAVQALVDKQGRRSRRLIVTNRSNHHRSQVGEEQPNGYHR